MLRFTFTAGLGLGTLMIVPTVVDGGATPNSLEDALQRTVAALEHLSGVEQRLRQRDPSAVALALAATETPLPTNADDPKSRDAQLDVLREEVTRLQGELEHDDANADARPALVEQHVTAPATIGLDDAAREALASQLHAATVNTAPRSDATKAEDDKQSFEREGYAADPLRLGHAYFRHRDFERALAMFSLREDDLDASYWRARCLEQLGRLDEAIAGLESIAANGTSAWAADRAREDLDFLRWRAAMESKLARKADKP